MIFFLGSRLLSGLRRRSRCFPPFLNLTKGDHRMFWLCSAKDAPSSSPSPSVALRSVTLHGVIHNSNHQRRFLFLFEAHFLRLRRQPFLDGGRQTLHWAMELRHTKIRRVEHVRRRYRHRSFGEMVVRRTFVGWRMRWKRFVLSGYLVSNICYSSSRALL